MSIRIEVRPFTKEILSKDSEILREREKKREGRERERLRERERD